jgi:hypothetical protein
MISKASKEKFDKTFFPIFSQQRSRDSLYYIAKQKILNLYHYIFNIYYTKIAFAFQIYDRDIFD